MTPGADRKRLLFLFFFSAAILMIGTRSSPLYPTNDWVDAYAFFTMGKGMMNGQVLYRDLFEQKGPLLYFLHGLASLVSDRSFLGVYLLEVLSFTVWLWITWKTVILWAEGRHLSFAAMLLTLVPLAFLTVNTSTFNLGDSAEEYCLPIVAAGFYLMSLRLRRERDPGTDRGLAGGGGLLLGGVLAGCMIWIKFTLAAFWLGWILAILVDLLLRRRYRPAILSAIRFAAGIGLATIPWVVYFGINHAVHDWLYSYLTVNFRYYPNDFPDWFRPFVVFGLYCFHSFHNLPLFLLTAGGVVHLIRRRSGSCLAPDAHETPVKPVKTRDPQAVRALRAVWLCLGFLACGVYLGGRAYTYYYLVFAPFSILGCVAARPYVERLADRIAWIGKAAAWITAFAAILVTLSLTYLYNPNSYAMSVHKEDLVQTRFAKIILEDDKPSLLNYGYIDLGFYLAAGLQPQVRFFENQAIPRAVYPVILDEQERYIAERLVRFVVFRVDANAPAGTMVPAVLADNYDPIATRIQEYRGKNFRYELYRVKDG